MLTHVVICGRIHLSNCMRSHLSIRCDHVEATERSCRRCLDRTDARPADGIAENRARLPRREVAAARLVRRPMGARSGGPGGASALRDREADADRAIQHLAPDRSLGRAGLCRAPAVRGGWPRPARGHNTGWPGDAEADVADLCAGHKRSRRPSRVGARSDEPGKPACAARRQATMNSALGAKLRFQQPRLANEGPYWNSWPSM